MAIERRDDVAAKDLSSDAAGAVHDDLAFAGWKINVPVNDGPMFQKDRLRVIIGACRAYVDVFRADIG